MKIALIEPRSPDYHVYSHLAIPRLGLPLLATILERQGHRAKVYVEDVRAIGPSEARDILRSDLVGISCVSSTAPRGYAMARLLGLKGVPVVFGGVHPTFMPEEPLKYADYVIKGEAEEAMPALVEALEGRRSLDQVPNLLYNCDGQVVRNPERPLSMKLDEIPSPDFGLIHGHEKMKIFPVMTTRGCPHGCIFCCVTPMFGQRYRSESTERVIEDLRRIGRRQVFFCDDNLTASPSHTKELLRQMLSRGVMPSRWYAQVRAEIYHDAELLDLMRRTGCRRVFIGFESVNQKVLDSYGKHQSLADVRHSVAAFHKQGIGVHGMFMFGADEDDMATFGNTVRFALEHDLDTVQFLILTPVPGSALFEQLDAEGRIFTRDWGIYDGHHVVFEPARMSPLELQMGTIRAMRRFYSLGSVARSISGLRLTTAMFRYLGRRVVRAWHGTNARFMQHLRNWQAGRSGFPREFSLGPLELALPLRADRGRAAPV